MLFQPDKKQNKSNTNKFTKGGTAGNFIGSAHDYLRKHLEQYGTDQTDTIHFTSNGRFALHDIIIYYAKQIELANIIVSSFNVSVPAARKIIRAYDYGLFSSFRFILNAQKRSNFINAIRLIDGKFMIKFTAVHAKVALIYNKTHNITVVTSGNLSSNNNIERGYIAFDKQTFDFDYAWMTGLFKT